MQTKEYTFIDRSKWPTGEWSGEPDKVQWQDQETGLPCIAKRNVDMGFWCGYVGISEDHPLFGKSYEDIDINCIHGGLTFSGLCEHDDNEHGICHVPDVGKPDRKSTR